MTNLIRLMFAANMAIAVIMLISYLTKNAVAVPGDNETRAILGALILTSLLMTGVLAYFTFKPVIAFLGIIESNWKTKLARTFTVVNVALLVSAIAIAVVGSEARTLLFLLQGLALVGFVGRWIFLGQHSYE